jgi:predicted aldo/keto reductase-like oxidoreductase
LGSFSVGIWLHAFAAQENQQVESRNGQSIDVIRYGIDLGINYIDTAWPYHLGDSEKILGKALKDGYRDRVHLVTKLPMFMVTNSD